MTTRFDDPLGQYSFSVPLGWALSVYRSHLITVTFTRSDRIAEHLTVRALSTVAPGAPDEEWFRASRQRGFLRHVRSAKSVRVGGRAAFFAESRSQRRQGLLMRGVRMDVAVTHHEAGVTESAGASEVLSLVGRTLDLPTDAAATKASSAERVHEGLRCAAEAAERKDWDEVRRLATGALTAARANYLASVVDASPQPPVSAALAVSEALELLGRADANLWRLRHAELVLRRALRTVSELPHMQPDGRRTSSAAISERLTSLDAFQVEFVSELAESGAWPQDSDPEPVPMRRAHAWLRNAAVAFERGNSDTAVESAQAALDDVLAMHVLSLEMPDGFRGTPTAEVGDKLAHAGATSVAEQADLSRLLVKRMLLDEMSVALRTIAVLYHAVGAERDAYEASELRLEISRTLDRPEPSPAGDILPSEGHRLHLVAALLDRIEHDVLAGSSRAYRDLDRASWILDEVKEGSALRVRHGLLEEAAALLREGTPPTASPRVDLFRRLGPGSISRATLTTLATWAVGTPPLTSAEAWQPVSIPRSALEGGAATLIEHLCLEHGDSTAAAFWRATGAAASSETLSDAMRIVAQSMHESDWRPGWARAALRALDGSLPAHHPGLLLGLEFSRACLVQPPVLIHYAMAQRLERGGASDSEPLMLQVPDASHSPFGDPTVQETLSALDRLVAAQEATPSRFHDVLRDMAEQQHVEFHVAQQVLREAAPGDRFRSAVARDAVGGAFAFMMRLASERAEERGDRDAVGALNSPGIRVAARYGSTADYLLAVERAAAVSLYRTASPEVLAVVEHLRIAAVWLGDADIEATVQHAIGTGLREFLRKAPGILDAVAAYHRAVTLRDQLGQTIQAAGSLNDLSTVLIGYGSLLERMEGGNVWAPLARSYVAQAMLRLVRADASALTLRYLGESYQNRARLHMAAGDSTAAASDAVKSVSLAVHVAHADLETRARQTYAEVVQDPTQAFPELLDVEDLCETTREEAEAELGPLARPPRPGQVVHTVLETLSALSDRSLDAATIAELILREVESSRGYTYNRWLGSAPNVGLQAVYAALEEDPSQPVLACYVVTREQISLIVIDAEAPPRLFPIPIKQLDLELLVESHLRGLRKQGRLRGGVAWARFQAEFTERGVPLVAPLEPFVAAGRTICVAPHRALHAAALHTLPTSRGGTPIGLRTPLYTNPSVTNWLVARDNATRPAAGSFVGVAGPESELDGFAEATSVAQALVAQGLHVTTPAPERLDVDALRPGEQPWRLLHLSSHGFFDPQTQEMGLLLSHEGNHPPSPRREVDDDVYPHLAGPNQLRRRGVGARLAFLASCLSSRSEVFAGDDLMGITRALFASGSSDLVAGTWAVVSSVVPSFTEAFYATLLDGQPVAASMLVARKAAAGSHPDPFFWAVFAHQGANTWPFDKSSDREVEDDSNA